MADDRFLVIGEQGNQQFFLLLSDQPDPKMIIGEGDGSGGSGGIRRKSVGTILAQQQLGDRPTITAKGTALGTLLLTGLYNKTKSKLVIPITGKAESILLDPTIQGVSTGKIKLESKCKSTGIIIVKESCMSKCKLLIKSIHTTESTIRIINPLKQKLHQTTRELKRRKLLEIKSVLEALRKVPDITLDVNSDVIQRGNMIRISANMNEQTGQIWMRIIDTKGMIVQKAGIVKKNATGFQVLVGTKDLNAGKYIVQVSNHKNFSPLGVVPFQVKGVAPPVGVLALLPLLFLPDSPQKFKKVKFKTMMDSRTDDVCREFENKIFDVKDPDIPIPPIHFNCRCHLEGVE